MAEDKNSVWTSGLAVNLVSNLIAAIVGATVTYLSHEGSTWVKPVLAGGAAWLITFCSILAYRISKNLPARAKPTTVDNVQYRIRDWLDRFNVTVKSVSDPQYHFLFIVTPDSGKKISIARPKDISSSDYILVRGMVTVTEDERAVLATFTEDEKAATVAAMQLELSRAVVGYRTDKGLLEDITVFKRIPITASLNVEEIINLVWDIEAMLGTLFTIGSIAASRHKAKQKDGKGGSIPV